MRSIVFVGSGKIAVGKLAQALDHGALTLQIAGDFDACMNRMQEAADRLGLYLMNSINPFRLEGQKTIIYRVLESLAWEPPEWIVVPGGNLGNTSAFGKALHELRELGLIRRLPRLAVVNATGANTFAKLFNQQGLRWRDGDWDAAAAQAFDERIRREGRTARTVASAIEIARPVNLPKALRSLAWTDGVVCEVSDEEILNDRALLARHGLGCEPASAASLAGLRRLMADGTIGRDDRTVCILTGHALKDPSAVVGFHTGGRLDFVPAACEPTSRSANRPIPVADDIESVCRAIESSPI